MDNLQGQITSFDPDPFVGYTAYTITNGTLNFEMFDFVNGETIFETKGYGMNPEDYLLRECGYAIQGVCDSCNVLQIYNDGGNWVQQDVFNDRGVWDVDEEYEPTDFVFHDGCCYYAISSVIAGTAPDPLDLTSSFWRLCYGSCPLSSQLPSKYDCIGGTCVLISPTSTYYPTAQFQGPTTADALTACVSNPCVPTTGDPIHYNCNNGICTPVSPSAPGWSGADHVGVGALALCQAAQLAGTCVNVTSKYNCVPDGSGGANCQPTPAGIYPDLLSCQTNCTVNVVYFDWYCSDVTPTIPNPSGQACTAVVQGDPPPGNATIPLQGPYGDKTTCESDGCGVSVLEYYCVCTLQQNQTIVDLGSGTQFGGNSCTGINNGHLVGLRL